MKHLNVSAQRKFTVAAAVAVCFALLSMPTYAASGFESVVAPVVDLLNALLTPVLAVVGAAGSIYCVFLGIKYAKAEEVQDREKAKSHLKNAIIGFVLIFVLILGLRLLMPVMEDWVADAARSSQVDPIG